MCGPDGHGAGGVPGAAGETSSILEEPYGIPGLPMADGPAGLRLTRCYDVSNDTGLAVPAGIKSVFPTDPTADEW